MFTAELELFIETTHRARCRQNGTPQLILIKVNLPALQNPLANLFREVLAREYGLREAQIDELRDLARRGEVELMFLLDAYDELREEVLSRRDSRHLSSSRVLRRWYSRTSGEVTT